MGLVDKILRAGEGKAIKQLAKIAQQVNKFENEIISLDDNALRNKTNKFKERYANGESLDSILPEAFAVVREAAKRTLGQRHYDVQLMGGAALHRGNIAEMKTGEGKTLVSTLPAYLNALTGKGVHIVTVNDYLAERDSEWMGRVHRFLGLKVGVILASMSPAERREAYAADITYGTNNEFGFDYLRDNMAWSLADCVQRDHNFAIVDEVDSILIDEARTPLIISGPADKATKWYLEFANLITKLNLGQHYEVDIKKRTVGILEEGVSRVEEALGIENLYEAANTPMIGYLNNAIRAKELFKRDKDYVVMDGELLIVDEHTGRMLAGRRYSDGLHQALEAKERIDIKDENQTLATITLQNYFRLYEKLSGMTGTAMTEASEFMQIYKLGVIPIPTNKKMQRIDQSDLIYKSEGGKFIAVANDIVERHKKGQPVLVGTSSIESSEGVSALLKKHNIKHEVLNAKQHQREAEIIANAGAPGAVTISTNMAGRGTDIVLGGRPPEEATEPEKNTWKEKHERVISSGGLHIIGTERNESRRVDNQLRGRSGRQGDIGSTRFYLSLEDSLMKIFASEKTASMMKKLGMKEGEALEHSWLNKTIANAQKKVEGMHYDARKHLLEYDDVANDQRKVIYQLRDELMGTDDVKDRYEIIRESVISDLFAEYISPQVLEEDWDVEGLHSALILDYGSDTPIQKRIDDGLDVDELLKTVLEDLALAHEAKENTIGSETMRVFEKAVMLRALDHHWKEHLSVMDHLRQSVNLRGYGQKNPVQEFKRESFSMFTLLLEVINIEMVKALCSVDTEQKNSNPEETPRAENPQSKNVPIQSKSSVVQRSEATRRPVKPKKVGRNDPCPCGSGKKYKHCHG